MYSSLVIPTEQAVQSTKRFDYSDPDKIRGGYYTPEPVASWLSRWALRSASDRVLEPSCGNGSFIVAASQRLQKLGCPGQTVFSRISGIELMANEANEAERRLVKSVSGFWPANSPIVTGDFFDWAKKNSDERFDVVMGNPPFIRYQAFPEPHRSRAMEWLTNVGLKPNRLTNIWVPFVSTAVRFLREGGRMALVLPAELLQVGYAAQLRQYLSAHFRSIEIVTCNELFFEKAEQEVILLLADGARPHTNNGSTKIRLVESRELSSLIATSPQTIFSDVEEKTIHHDEEKWLKCFLSNREIGLMRALRKSKDCATLSHFAKPTVGIVTGCNDFFVLRKKQVRLLGLTKETVRLVSKSAQLQGAMLLDEDFKRLNEEDHRVHLLNLGRRPFSSLTPEAQAYIRFGEDLGYQRGYKCSIRTPWYDVPSVWTPDAFFFRQVYDFPRIVFNHALANCTDTIHRIKVNDGIDSAKFCSNAYTYLTAASAEIEGRSYGGGVLELEPSEAGKLLFPSNLAAAMPISDADRLIRKGRLEDVLEYNSKSVLQDEIGLSSQDCIYLRDIWERMRNRRLQRNRRKGLVR